jgi:hypothetical protein
MMGISDIGNIFQRSSFKLPTIDMSRTQIEFPSTFHLFEFLRYLGE